jgi:uncharacterized membrane protein
MDIFNILGRFHLILLHFPIGILLLVAILEFIAHKKNNSEGKKVTQFLLLAGVGVSIATAYFGWLLSGKADYDPKLMFWHKWLGLGTVSLTVLIWYFRNSPWYLPLLGVSVVSLLATGHYGGALSHGENYLTEPFFPTPIFSAIPKTRPDNHEKVFKSLIAPILDKKCVSCHNATKSKGKLRLDTPDFIQKGGEHGVVFIPQNAAQSELYRRTTLPMKDDLHMPPRSSVQLTPQELALIKWWIEQGADFKKTMENIKFTGDLERLFD